MGSPSRRDRLARHPLLALPLLVALAVAGAPGCGEPAPQEPQPCVAPGPLPPPPTNDLAVPVGGGVTLDGVVTADEWTGSAVRQVGAEGAAVRLLQSRGDLLVAFEAGASWPSGSRLWLGIAPDVPGSGLYVHPAVRVDFEPMLHDRPHLLAFRISEGGMETPVEGPVARGNATGPRPAVEIAVPLAALGVTALTPKALRLVVLFARGEGLGPITWPAGISTDGPVGKPPPDLASSARWARLSGWEDPEGPGALDLATRAALRSRNDEIARRGRAAYDAGAAMSGGEETPKKDREQVPALLGNLAAVAAEEPLAPEDLLLLARGLRFLNRKPEALAVLSGLDAHPGWRGSARLLYERALTLESAEDFAAAQATWEALVRGGSAAYGRMADRAAERLAGWQAEAEARAADEARGDLPLVLLRTNRGNVVLLLHRADVEASVDHFLALVRRREGDRGFYDGTLFHRVVGDFMAQGGDPASRDASCEDAGRGDGPSTLPVEVNRRHGFWRGAVGFARGKAAWNGCQFFLLVSPRPELAEKGFTCFGHVVAGLSAVDRLEACDVLLEARVLRPEAGPAPQPEGER